MPMVTKRMGETRCASDVDYCDGTSRPSGQPFLSANFELAALLARLNDASTHELFFAFENVFAKMCAKIWDVGLLNVVSTCAIEPILITHPVLFRRSRESAV